MNMSNDDRELEFEMNAKADAKSNEETKTKNIQMDTECSLTRIQQMK